MKRNGIYLLLILCLVIAFSLCFINQTNAYYGMYGGLYGMYGGLYGMYGGLYGMYGGGTLLSGTGNRYINYPVSMYNGYGIYGGLYGMYGMV